MSNVPGMVYRDNPHYDDGFVFINNHSEELTGYTVEELLDNDSCHFRDIIHLDDQDRVKTVMLANKNRWKKQKRIL